MIFRILRWHITQESIDDPNDQRMSLWTYWCSGSWSYSLSMSMSRDDHHDEEWE